MANATEVALAAALCAAATAAAALAGADATAADGDPAQREIIRRETAGLDKSITGIKEEIGRVKEASAGGAAWQGHGGGKRGQDRFDPGAIRISFLESEIERLRGSRPILAATA